MTGAGFRHAPVHILVLGDPRVNETYPIRTRLDKSESHFFTSLGNATLIIHFAATSLGLSSQYVSDASSPYFETMLKAHFDIPEPLKVYHLIPIGYASGTVAPRPRRELSEIVHSEKYEHEKFRDEKTFKKFVMTASRRGAYGRKTWVEDDVQR